MFEENNILKFNIWNNTKSEKGLAIKNGLNRIAKGLGIGI